MKKSWFLSIIASAPVLAAFLALQSCGGVGGATTGNGGQGNTNEAFLALLSNEQKNAKYTTPEDCAACHGGKSPEDPIYKHWKETVHANKGVTCESCHGPGSVHKANPTKENILSYPKIVSSVVCAQCHGPIADQFDFSKHSKLIADPVEEAVTDPGRYGKTSRCIACHSGLVRAEIVENGKNLADLSDDEIRELAENTLTVVPHSVDCATCHNPHSKTGNLSQGGEEMQLRHQVFNLDTAPIGPGQTPDVFTQYDHICAQCHNGRGTNPADAALEKGTARPSMHDSNQMQMLMGFGGVEGNGPVKRNTAHAQAPGQCTKCHMPDSRHTFTVSFDKGCSPCHTATDAAVRADTIKSEVLNLLVALRTRMEGWAKDKLGNRLFWEYTSNIQAEGLTPPDQANVPIEIKRARHNYYFVVRSGDYGVHNAPYAKHLMTVANDNLDALGAAKPNVPNMDQATKLRLIEADKQKASRLETSGTR